MFYTKLALASLVNNRRQYRSLFWVCVVGTALILASSMITDGMLKSVRQKARQYYGGDVQFMGGWRGFDIQNADEIVEKILKAEKNNVKIFKRYEYDAKNSSIYFEGESVRQRIFKGVDFEAEKDLFEKFTFTEGRAEASEVHNTMVLSEPIAQKLALHSGDMVTLQVQTIYGYTNTMNLIVTGIFQDSSLFGMYTSYIDIEALRKATGYPSSYVNRICIYGNSNSYSRLRLNKLQRELEKDYHMYQLTEDKNTFYNALSSAPEERLPLYALISLDANIKDLEILIDAIKTVIILITVILTAIISVGIGSTYRIIVMKRITEIGIYRALGMKSDGIRKLFITESSLLMLAGLLSGLILGVIISVIMAQFNFSFIPAFDIFLVRGHIIPKFNVLKLFLLMTIIGVTTLLSVLFTIRHAVHISPVGALATTA